jgi:predicted signal transduction protein with EAL and GGDEF domain
VTDAGELLRRADTALDAAKRHGSRFRRYATELDEIAAQDAQLGADLRRALDSDDQFYLVYQPIVDLPRGRTVAVEALVRWQHPIRGVVSPVEFIPLAERNGLIVELGAWIMRTACRRAVAWGDEMGADAPRYVSVNVSAHQLAQPDFAEFVGSVLASTGLAGEHLLVEVTETAIFSGGIAVRAHLRSCGPWAYGSRSMISAPAIRRWACSRTSRSTCSRSTSRSSTTSPWPDGTRSSPRR